ncbi:MAG: SMI1/KNR4 family protein [Planctomycetes bacterium]|nr:SMI1/KNR4 family protein [Planctomycetota bacterium]
MDASSIIAGWQRRLVTMANTPEYVFRDTPQHLIEQHYRRLTTFDGYSEAEVVAAEEGLGVRFPAVFREYLRVMAKSSGDLFRGSNRAGIAEFKQFRAGALKLLAETDPALALPPEAVVFLSHQGYTFVYLLAVGGFDGPPMQWTETEQEPRQVAETFADMVDAELRLMESNNAASRTQGGYYLTIRPEGGSSRLYPALACGVRALDQVLPDKT